MKRLPIGVEDFKELIDHQYYYIDKTMFVQVVLKEKVVLYTRPRRFWKTLNMSRRCPPRRAVLFFLNQTKGKRVPF
ncbi:MAG: AAA family ATPase [Erysipelotrichaceae bacterium]|nr:AAA family ATPase [Erysipelotrichaceae bacterium]